MTEQIQYTALDAKELQKRISYYRTNLRCKDKDKTPWLQEMREVWQQLLAICEAEMSKRN